LSQNDFTPIASKQTIDHDVDVADIYNLEAGNWHVSTKSLIPYAEEDSFELSGESLPFLSNQLLLALDAKHETDRTMLKRTTIQSDCSGDQNTSVVNANKECARMANAAAQEAESGSEDTFNTFFKTTSESARKQVAEGFRKVADECATTPGGTSTSSCTDQKHICSGNLLAYTSWKEQDGNTEGQTYYCPRYFNELPATGEQCEYQNQGSTTLHEMTHALLSTEDITYGLENCKSLSSSQALVNADSYTFYAIGEYCSESDCRAYANVSYSCGSEVRRQRRQPEPVRPGWR
jgi:deuterolysin